MKKIARFAIWICRKFTRVEIEEIIKELSDILKNRNPEVKPRDDFQEKHPNYRRFFVDSLAPLKAPKDIHPTVKLEGTLAPIPERTPERTGTGQSQGVWESGSERMHL